MKKALPVILIALCAGYVFAGASGVTSTIKESLQPRVGGGDGSLQYEVKETVDDIITELDTIEAGTQVKALLTVTGKSTLNGEAEMNDDVDINLGDTDEEISIAQTNTAGAADTPMMDINDDRTGATANTAGEATIKIDAEGTHAIGVIDGIVAVESVVDTYAAGTLNLGDSVATKIEIADTGIETEIQGTMDCQEAVTFAVAPVMVATGTPGSVTASAVDTLPSGSTTNEIWISIKVGATTYVVPGYAQP